MPIDDLAYAGGDGIAEWGLLRGSILADEALTSFIDTKVNEAVDGLSVGDGEGGIGNLDGGAPAGVSSRQLIGANVNGGTIAERFA